LQIAGGTLLATELIERVLGFDRLESFVRRLAAQAERFSGIEAGGAWPFALAAFLGAALLLSCPFVVGVYAVLALGFAVLPRLQVPLLLLLWSLASVIWLGLAVLGLAARPSKSPPEARRRRAVGVDGGTWFSWTFWPPGSGMQRRASAARAAETVEDEIEPEEEDEASTLCERLSLAVVLSSALPVAAAASLALFLTLFPPFFLVWLLSRGMARLAEALRTAAVVAGFVLFLLGLCLQLSATF
jgi:hypothetical protein